jgi:hypothetical protein
MIESNEIRTRNGVDELYSTSGLVLDKEYPASEINPFDDAPYSAFLDIEHLNRSDTFQTYLMWKFGGNLFPNSIWVPICVTNWWWSGDASLDVNGMWRLNNSPDDHSPDPGSVNTTDFPTWTRAYPEALKKQP